MNVFAILKDYRYREGELGCFYRANKFWPVKDKKKSWGFFLRWIGTQLLLEFFSHVEMNYMQNMCFIYYRLQENITSSA